MKFYFTSLFSGAKPFAIDVGRVRFDTQVKKSSLHSLLYIFAWPYCSKVVILSVSIYICIKSVEPEMHLSKRTNEC